MRVSNRRGRVKGEGGRVSVPRSIQDFIPNSAKRRNFVFGGWTKARSVEYKQRAAVGGRKEEAMKKDQEPRSAKGASERSGNFLKLRLLNLISRCAGASAQKS